MKTFFIRLKDFLLNIVFNVFYIIRFCVVSAVLYLILFLLAIGVGLPIAITLILLELPAYVISKIKNLFK